MPAEVVGPAHENFVEPLEDMANQVQLEEPPPQEFLDELPTKFQAEQAESPPEEEATSAEEEVDEFQEDIEAIADESEEVEEPEAEGEVKVGGAQGRIRNLVKQRKELETQVAHQQQEFQRQMQAAQYQQAQQAQAQMQAQQQQMEIQRRQLELLQSKAQQEEESNLSPMEQYRRGILKDARTEVSQALQPEIEGLKQQLAQEQQLRQQAYEQAQARERFAKYSQQAAQARSDLIFKDIDPDKAQAMSGEMDEMLLAYCAAFGVEPKDGATRFKKYMDRYVSADLDRRTKKNGKKVKKSQGIPQTAAPGRAPATGSEMPKLWDLKKAGYESHLDWMADGEPPIRK